MLSVYFCTTKTSDSVIISSERFRMFCRSLLASRHLVLSVQKATLARQTFTPRVTRVLDKDGRLIQDAPPPPVPKSLHDDKYDDSFMFEEERVQGIY